MAEKQLFENDKFLFQLLSSKYLKQALDVMNNSFLMHENVCRAVHLPENPEACAELEALAIRTAKDGVSVIAIDKQTDQVVGVAFNKLQVKDSEQGLYFENFAKSCKHDSSRAVVQFMADADAQSNLFELCKIDCLLEIMFLMTLSKYRGQGIAQELCECTIKVGRKLLNGENIKQSIVEEEILPLQPVPKAVSAIFTTFITQKIGRTLGFKIEKTFSYNELEYKGEKFSSVIGDSTPNYTVEYLKL